MEGEITGVAVEAVEEEDTDPRDPVESTRTRRVIAPQMRTPKSTDSTHKRQANITMPPMLP